MSEDYVKDIFDDGRDDDQYADNGWHNYQKFDEKNYLNTRLNKGETTRKIKIRPVKTLDVDGVYKFAIPIHTHSIMLNDKQKKANVITKGSKFKSFICREDSHVDGKKGDCPLCNKMNELLKYADESSVMYSDEWKSKRKEAYKYKSKTTYILKCIERGKESEGVKFMRFNARDDRNGIFDTIRSIYLAYRFPTDSNGQEYYTYAKNPETGEIRVDRNGNMIEIRNPDYIMPAEGEYEDIFDINNGRDIILTLSRSDNSDKTSISVMADVKQTPLAKTKEEIEMITCDKKDWSDMYKVKTYQYLEIVAEGESPVWDKNTSSYVKWVDPEEFKKDNEDKERQAAEELKEKNFSNEETEELPF